MIRIWKTAAILAVLVSFCGVSLAKSTWVTVTNIRGATPLCLTAGGTIFDYTALGPGETATCMLTGPRRLKLIGRYIFDSSDPSQVPYSIAVSVDGQEMLRKAFTGRPHSGIATCSDARRVGSLRKGYLDLPAGTHELTFRMETEGRGQVAMRLFRQIKRKRDRWMAIAPETYGEMRHLEFESGTRSSYYHFDAGSPLRFMLNGPTTVRVRTRLDFDHTMNGSQTYTLDVLLDGEHQRTFHFDATKLSSAVYLERPDILPGDRKELRIDVPRGQHTLEIRCVRPDACGVAAMIHIPKRDLER